MQNVKPVAMDTTVGHNAIAVIELVAATWPTRGPWVGAGQAGGNVESAWTARNLSWSGRFG